MHNGLWQLASHVAEREGGGEGGPPGPGAEPALLVASLNIAATAFTWPAYNPLPCCPRRSITASSAPSLTAGPITVSPARARGGGDFLCVRPRRVWQRDFIRDCHLSRPVLIHTEGKPFVQLVALLAVR